MGRRSLTGLGVALALVAAACGGGGGKQPTSAVSWPSNPKDITGTIRLLSYTDGYDPHYIESFHQEYPNIDLETSAMDNNEAAIAKIQAGFQVDVINS